MGHKISISTEINSFYVIVSGLFRFNEKAVDEKKLQEHYCNWRHRIFNGNYAATFKYINQRYYDSYLNNIFPEIRYRESDTDHFNPKILNHLTRRECLENQEYLKGLKLPVNDETTIQCGIEHIDLYLFPHEIGIFSLKFFLEKEQDMNLGTVSAFLNKIRYLTTGITISGTEQSMALQDFLENNVLKLLKLDENWADFNPQLKTYTCIDLKEEIPENEMDFLLYDIGNFSVIGSAKGEGVLAPSENYFREQIHANKVSVFRNWSVLTLYDTFTRISINFPDQFKSWEYDYLNLYIHCLYQKFYMYLTNSELSNITVVSKRTEKIRDRFIEFINDYHHSHISYRFLPDLLQDKLLQSLEIHAEIERMETKIQRINEHFQERREKSFNIALIIITLLSVFSVLYDVSEWTIKMGVSRGVMYPWVSITNGIIIFLLIYIIFRKGRK